jgi:hypothetical protein
MEFPLNSLYPQIGADQYSDDEEENNELLLQ